MLSDELNSILAAFTYDDRERQLGGETYRPSQRSGRSPPRGDAFRSNRSPLRRARSPPPVTELLIVLEVVRLVFTAVAPEVLLSGVEAMQEAIEEDQGRRRDVSHREETKDPDLLYEDDQDRRMETEKQDPQEVEGQDLHPF
ncbi:MAG: hypothetical protein M1830_003067 [Pleopsidium flavum]|nr:MAG: hypothetical protein M1830_003067 [Pleopsidium flavum]